MTLVSTTLVFVLSGCGPIAQMPGVRLGGTEVASPSSWNEVEIPDEVQLRTVSLLPRVVNLWAVKAADVLWVSGEEDSGWVRNIASASEVHLRVRDDVFVLRATRIADLATKTRVGEAYLQKYRGVIAGGGVEWGPDFLKDYILFRLDPR